MTHLFGAVVAEIREWLQREWNASIRHILREANVCADFMAKEGSMGNERLVVLHEPTVGLVSLLRDDFMGTWSLRS